MLWGAQVQQWGRGPKAHCSGIAQKAYGFETLKWVVAQCGMPINLVLQTGAYLEGAEPAPPPKLSKH